MPKQPGAWDLPPRQPLADQPTAPPPGPRSQGSSPQSIPTLTITSHPMGRRVGERLLLEALLEGREVALSRNTPDFTPPGAIFGQPLDDPFMSRTPVSFSLGPEGRVRLQVPEGGTRVSSGEPLVGMCEFTPEQLAAGVPLVLSGRVVLLLHMARREAPDPADLLGMVGGSTSLWQVREHIARIADLSVPVLVRGETGTGKELVAQAIHQKGPRRARPFVSVNLGAIPRELAAAELFGAQKGAYTGASQSREGFFRAAQGGTLFLDEVGEAPTEVQVMLLRVLETGEFYPVGAQTPFKADVRLISATDALLEERIREGVFKAPLLHRLAGYDIRLPPLRERREDIGLLFFHFAREQLEAMGEAWRLAPQDPFTPPWVPAELALRMVRYAWPGNIRQLRNFTRQLVIASRGQATLQLDPRLAQELDAAAAPLPAQARPVLAPPEPRASPRRKASEVGEQELLAALREHAWDLKAASDQLGIPRSSIYDLIDKSPHLRTAGEVSAEELRRCFEECQGGLEAMVRKLEVSKRALKRRLKELGLTAHEG